MLAITFYSAQPNKPEGLPDEWPFSTRLIQDASEALEGETVMTELEYADYIEQHRPAYDAWQAGLIPPTPNYSAFRLALYQSPGYRALVSAAIAVPLVNHYLSTMQSIMLASPLPDMGTVQLFWSLLLESLPDSFEPTSGQIAEWNQIAEWHAIPFRFDAQTGKLFEQPWIAP